MNCIETRELTHCFKKSEPVVNALDLLVPQGSIYGFLGQNGAGKTTTLRLILGLLKKQQGHILVFNQPVELNRIRVLRQIGSLIESPSLYAQLTAYENLQVLQKIYDCPKARINYVLQLAGLSDTTHKKVGQFSLGMKQRLALAMALLHDPKLLILDEPTNGLDPAGIIEMRELLKKLNKEQGITILISSHLLSEIERLATHLGVIHKGRLLFQGTLEQLVAAQGLSSRLVLDTNDNERSLALALPAHPGCRLEEGRLIVPAATGAAGALLIRSLVHEGIDIYQAARHNNDLESVFIGLTNHPNA